MCQVTICHECGQSIRVVGKLVDKKITCLNCKTEFFVEIDIYLKKVGGKEGARKPRGEKLY